MYLTKRRSITPDIAHGIYPFKDIKLSRADVEWLLATHENGRGPVEWSDGSQHDRVGLDLRGAHLQSVELDHLPLARIQCGLATRDWWYANEEQREAAAAHLEKANLDRTHLEGAALRWAHLEGASLFGAYLQEARLRAAKLSGAQLQRAHLEGASLVRTHLAGQTMPKYVPPANMRGAFFDTMTNLDRVILGDEQHGAISLADISWGGVNLAVVDWSAIRALGDEDIAHQSRLPNGGKKDAQVRLREYQAAVRANRQLAVALQAQGLSEDAARFAYRAQLLQRIVWRRERKVGRYLFSLMLDIVAGYGYRPGRCLIVYLLALTVFTVAHYLIGVIAGPHLTLLSALATSVQSLHGRVFSFQTGDPQTLLNTVEAFVGLFIEAIVVAVITQRILGK
jgi:uncharacterized protein YjbI with pentapeptide repeats